MTLTLLEPVDAEMAALMLQRARADRRTVFPRGSGSKSAWHRGTARDLTMSMRSLAVPLQHYAGDLVATIPAGMTLADANAQLAGANQWLPLDPAYADTATIGGIVATNDSGPRRHRFGAPRDLIVGIEVALADGRVARAGGRVVKNVAGYDLSRLFCGSMGALGVITSATFKLVPRPAASRTVIVTVGRPSRAAELALAIDALPVTPTAIEVTGGAESALLVRFETTPHSAERMAHEVDSVCRTAGVATTIVADDAEEAVWQGHRDAVWQAARSIVKVSVLPTAVEPVLTALAAVGGVRWNVAGRAALGVLTIALDGETFAVADAVRALEFQAAAGKGFVSLLQATAALREQVPAVRPASPLDQVSRAIKARFDPDGTLPDLA